MYVQTLEESPRNHRGGQVSYLLLSGGQFGSKNLAITWVEGGPDSEQLLHEHPQSEQVYVIVKGHGLMKAGDEEQEVAAGAMILVPPGTMHAIHNNGSEPLVFVSATVPPFEMPPEDSPFAYEPPARS